MGMWSSRSKTLTMSMHRAWVGVSVSGVGEAEGGGEGEGLLMLEDITFRYKNKASLFFILMKNIDNQRLSNNENELRT